jgi:hypothetical protein
MGLFRLVRVSHFAAGTFRGDFPGVFGVAGVRGEGATEVVADEVAEDIVLRDRADATPPIGQGGTGGTASVLSHR